MGGAGCLSPPVPRTAQSERTGDEALCCAPVMTGWPAACVKLALLGSHKPCKAGPGLLAGPAIQKWCHKLSGTVQHRSGDLSVLRYCFQHKSGLSIYLSIYLSVCLPACLLACLLVCLSVSLSVCRSGSNAAGTLQPLNVASKQHTTSRGSTNKAVVWDMCPCFVKVRVPSVFVTATHMSSRPTLLDKVNRQHRPDCVSF